jgi:hypothetical protein
MKKILFLTIIFINASEGADAKRKLKWNTFYKKLQQRSHLKRVLKEEFPHTPSFILLKKEVPNTSLDFFEPHSRYYDNRKISSNTSSPSLKSSWISLENSVAASTFLSSLNLNSPSRTSVFNRLSVSTDARLTIEKSKKIKLLRHCRRERFKIK